MKKKLIYLVIFIFCLSLFTRARQDGRNCDHRLNCPASSAGSPKQMKPSTPREQGFDVAPFRIFIFSI